LKLIISFSELLSDNRRKKLESLFKAPVFNNYAQKELPLLGFECRKQEGFHVHSDVVALEVTNDNRQVYDQAGTIVCTDLFDKCAPLIRYKSGDEGVLKSTPCSCGRGFPLLSNLLGRSNDFILCPRGFKISPVEIMCTMYSVKQVLKYRVIQKKIDQLEIKVVPSKSYSESDERLIRTKFKNMLPETDIKIKYVKNIPKDINFDKPKFIIQKLKNID